MASLILGISSSMASQLRSLSSTLQISNTRSLAGVPLHTSPSSISSVSISSTSTSSPIVLPMIYCGRGDRKTARGKRFSHSFGNARPQDKKKGRGPARAPVPPGPPRKDPYDDGKIIEIEITDDE